MPDLIMPESEEELQFHETMLANRASTEGIRILPDQDPSAWKAHWGEPDTAKTCYRLVYCDGCGYFVGDVGYRCTADNAADLWLMVLGDMRRDGYGSEVLKQIAKEAAKNGITAFRVVLPADHPDLEFFRKRYFRDTESDGERIVLTADTADLTRCRCQENVCSLSGHKM